MALETALVCATSGRSWANSPLIRISESGTCLQQRQPVNGPGHPGRVELSPEPSKPMIELLIGSSPIGILSCSGRSRSVNQVLPKRMFSLDAVLGAQTRKSRLLDLKHLIALVVDHDLLAGLQIAVIGDHDVPDRCSQHRSPLPAVSSTPLARYP
jgi:hypothetical protein